MFKVTGMEFNRGWYISSITRYATFAEAKASLGEVAPVVATLIHEVVLGTIMTCQEFETAWGNTRAKVEAWCFYHGSRGGYAMIEEDAG